MLKEQAPLVQANRVSGAKLDLRDTTLGRLCRWLRGDWWKLEEKRGRYGVWHSWRYHTWENYRFSLPEALQEQKRLNSGRVYGICKNCGCTYAGHPNGVMGIECPTLQSN